MRRVLALIIALGLAASSSMAAETSSSAEPAVEQVVETTAAQPAEPPPEQISKAAEANKDYYIRLGGFVRFWASMNLKDVPELQPASNAADPYDSAWKPSMFRGSLELSADAKTGPIKWRAVGRGDREVLTTYEKKLQDRNKRLLPGGPGEDLAQYYEETRLRELYAEFDLGSQVNVRLGKQQVVWGETDFFHPTDLIQGFDFRWRSFLEGESDELRKPLILANVRIAVPDANGSLQVVVRPGLDAKRDIGNTYSQSGGRWAAQPFRGEDFLGGGATRYDYDHPSGKYRELTGGLRWTGTAGEYNYALSWLRTFNPDPVFNPANDPLNPTVNRFYKKVPSATFGDWFYPIINVTAASISTEVRPIDAVINVEVAYHQKKLFNTGTSASFAGLVFPGVAGVKEKEIIQATLRADKMLRWTQGLLGTNAPSFFTVQLFDTWIQNFDKKDDIVENVGYGAAAKEHQAIFTAVLALDYMASTLKPQIAAGAYLQYGDAFVIPSIAYLYGSHWRFLLEGDIFIPKHTKSPVGQPLVGETESGTRGIGPLANSDQIMFRVTYQF